MKLGEVTKRSRKEIKTDLEQIMKEVGRDESLKVMVMMEPDREMYHVKDYYEGMIKFLYYRRQKRTDEYLTKLIKQFKI